MEDLPVLDDSLFGESRENVTEVNLMPYNAKVCERQWFLGALEPDEIDGAVNFHKYRADCHYLRKNYDKALAEYKILADMDLSSAVRRDAWDGLCRCLMKLGKLVQAIEVATKLVTLSVNVDHLLHALRSLATVQKLMGNYVGVHDSCKRCVHIYPCCGSLWLELAGTYDLLAGSSGGLETNRSHERLICLLYARLHCKPSGKIPSFLLEMSKSRLNDLGEKIEAYKLEEDLMEKLNTMNFQKNFVTTNQEIDAIRAMEDISLLFDHRWFSQQKMTLSKT